MLKLPSNTRRSLFAAMILVGGISMGGCTTLRDAFAQPKKADIRLPGATPLTFDCSEKLTIPDITKILYDQQMALKNQPLGDCYAAVNLNDKGKEEVLVQLTGSFYSGSGGNQFYIFTRDTGPWQMIADGAQMTFLNSVILTGDKSNGYADLNLRGSDEKTIKVRMKFDGKKYQSNTL